MAAASSSFYPKRTKRFDFVMSDILFAGLEECSKKEGRSMSEIVHLGAEIMVKKLQRKYKKEGK